MKLSFSLSRALLSSWLTVALSGLCAAPCPADLTYDASVDFDTQHNPSQIGNVYSYGYTNTLTGSAFNLLTTMGSSSSGSTSLDGWLLSSGTVPEISKNVGSTVYTTTQNGSTITIQPGQLFMHPGQAGQYADLKFTALISGIYSYTGTFNAADSEPTTTDVHVLINGVVDTSGGINVDGGGSTATLSDMSFTLAAGQTVDFVVGYGNGTYIYDSTGFFGSVTLLSVPEPASVWLVSIGVAGAVAMWLRRVGLIHPSDRSNGRPTRQRAEGRRRGSLDPRRRPSMVSSSNPSRTRPGVSARAAWRSG